MNVLIGVRSMDLHLALELILRDQPGVTVVAFTSNTEGVLALLQTVQLDLIIIQWDLPGVPAAVALAAARRMAHPPGSIVLGKYPGDECAAIIAGADHFVLIGEPPERLLNAISTSRKHRFLRQTRQ